MVLYCPGRITMTKTTYCFNVCTAKGVTLYVDGSGQVNGKSDYFWPGWWVPVAPAGCEPSLKLYYKQVLIDVPSTCSSNLRTTILIKVPVMSPNPNCKETEHVPLCRNQTPEETAALAAMTDDKKAKLPVFKQSHKAARLIHTDLELLNY